MDHFTLKLFHSLIYVCLVAVLSLPSFASEGPSFELECGEAMPTTLAPRTRSMGAEVAVLQ